MRNVKILQGNRRRQVASVVWPGLLAFVMGSLQSHRMIAVGYPLAVIVIGHRIGIVVGLVVVDVEYAVRRSGLGAIIVYLQAASLIGSLSTHLAENLLTAKGAHFRRKGITNRWVFSNVLGDAGSLAGGVGEFVAVDAGRLRRLGIVAGSAGEVKGIVLAILLRIEHVGAAES